MKTNSLLRHKYLAALILLSVLFLAPDRIRADILYAGNSWNGTIERYDTTSSTDLGLFASSPGYPVGLAFDKTENLFVANINPGPIAKLTPSGVWSYFAGANMSWAAGLGMDNAGNLYATDILADNIQKFSPDGTGSLFASTAGIPQELTLDASGNVYVSLVGNTIEKYSPTGVDLGAFASTGLQYPWGLAFDKQGNLFVANYDGNSIMKFTPQGVGSVFANTGLNGPQGLVFDSAGNLYVANYDGNYIEKFTPDGVGSVFATTGLNHPHDLAILVPEPSAGALLFMSAVLLATRAAAGKIRRKP
jgi:sugar lactone lactonase YvrE